MKKLYTLLLSLSCLNLTAQVNLRIGAAHTPSNSSAITVGFDYQRPLDSVVRIKSIFVPGKHSFFYATPSVEFTGGNADAAPMSSLVLQVQGIFANFKTKRLAITKTDSITTMDASRTVQTFLFAGGIETTQLFNIINGVVEAGWSPYYQSSTHEALRYTKLYFGLQGGYKFWASQTTVIRMGGLKSESSENVRTWIARAKGSFSADTRKIVKYNGLDAGLLFNADVWYDLVHSRYYHRLEGVVRTYLTDTKSFDMVYEKGAGAPLFNTGDQWGVKLNIKF